MLFSVLENIHSKVNKHHSFHKIPKKLKFRRKTILILVWKPRLTRRLHTCNPDYAMKVYHKQILHFAYSLHKIFQMRKVPELWDRLIYLVSKKYYAWLGKSAFNNGKNNELSLSSYPALLLILRVLLVV